MGKITKDKMKILEALRKKKIMTQMKQWEEQDMLQDMIQMKEIIIMLLEKKKISLARTQRKAAIIKIGLTKAILLTNWKTRCLASLARTQGKTVVIKICLIIDELENEMKSYTDDSN